MGRPVAETHRRNEVDQRREVAAPEEQRVLTQRQVQQVDARVRQRTADLNDLVRPPFDSAGSACCRCGRSRTNSCSGSTSSSRRSRRGRPSCRTAVAVAREQRRTRAPPRRVPQAAGAARSRSRTARDRSQRVRRGPDRVRRDHVGRALDARALHGHHDNVGPRPPPSVPMRVRRLGPTSPRLAELADRQHDRIHLSSRRPRSVQTGRGARASCPSDGTGVKADQALVAASRRVVSGPLLPGLVRLRQHLLRDDALPEVDLLARAPRPERARG